MSHDPERESAGVVWSVGAPDKPLPAS